MRTATATLTAATLAFAALGGGCAGYKLTPMEPIDPTQPHAEGSREGYVFYEPRPYLVGSRSADADGAFEFELVYLPNYQKPYRFTRYEFLAKSDLEIAFEDGWKFTGAKSSTDSTAALAALSALATKALGVASLGTAPDGAALVIFEINTDPGSGSLTLNQIVP